MVYFNEILRGIEYAERAQATINNDTAATFPWRDKHKQTLIEAWLLDLMQLALKDPAALGIREPLLFVLADKICREEKGHLLKYISKMQDREEMPVLQPAMKKSSYQWQTILPFVYNTLRSWEKPSQDYYETARKNLDELTSRPDTRTFFCMVREFHPRKIHGKHPWNEIQSSSIELLSTEEIITSVDDDPIEGSRFFLPGDKAPATGINISAGHHRIYVLYRRFINGCLENTCINGHCGGDILLRCVEKW